VNHLEPRIPKMKANQLKNYQYYIDDIKDVILSIRCSVIKYTDSHSIQVFIGYNVNWKHIIDDYINNSPGNTVRIGSYHLQELKNSPEVDAKIDLIVSSIKEIETILRNEIIEDLPEKKYWRKYEPNEYNLRINMFDKLSLINFNYKVGNINNAKLLAAKFIDKNDDSSITEYLDKIINGH